MACTAFLVSALISAVLMSSILSADATTNSVTKAFVELRKLVQSPGQPLGTPFPRLISKPSKDQRIAIVGAGLAGLHMAYLLSKNDYKNVVVLEKDSRFGGKVMSVHHNGVPHEMGACYTSPDYITNVYELAEELGIKDFVPIPPSTVWLDGNTSPMTYGKYVIARIMKLTGARCPVRAVLKLIDATRRYTKLHRNMFGKYKGDLMQKPSSDVLCQLNQTMLSFLTKNNLIALVPVLTAAHTMQGYGHIDRISALYGMMWDTPNFLMAMLSRALNISSGGTEMFRGGFMQLTDKLAAMVDVRLNVNIKKVKRDLDGLIKIKFASATNDAYDVSENFDYLIWAADAREALRVFDDTTSMETSFSRLQNTWFTTTLFDSTERCRSLTSIEYWLDNLNNKREHSMWARRNSNFVMSGVTCNSKAQRATKMSTVSYQMADSPPCGSFVDTMFEQHFAGCLGAKEINIIEKKTWNYFPRFSVKDAAEGILWKIAEYQGERNTWFIGSSVCFESTKSVIEYNKLMMERMKLY